MSEPNEVPRTCEACIATTKEMERLNARVDTLEHSCSRIREAFVKNDLGSPDYDGHRVAHATAIEKAKVVQGYQRDTTKKALEWLLVGVAVLLGQGVMDWIRAHLK